MNQETQNQDSSFDETDSVGSQQNIHGETSPLVETGTRSGILENPESIDALDVHSDKSVVELLHSEERRIVTIKPTAALVRQRLSVARALLAVAPENQARVAASNGHPWSIGQAHIDSPKSSKYGICLTAGLVELGIEQLQRGDLIQIEIGRGETCYQLIGRASRKSAAYFAKGDLAQAGVRVHTPFQYVVLGLVSQHELERGQP